MLYNTQHFTLSIFHILIFISNKIYANKNDLREYRNWHG